MRNPYKTPSGRFSQHSFCSPPGRLGGLHSYQFDIKHQKFAGMCSLDFGTNLFFIDSPHPGLPLLPSWHLRMASDIPPGLGQGREYQSTGTSAWANSSSSPNTIRPARILSPDAGFQIGRQLEAAHLGKLVSVQIRSQKNSSGELIAAWV